MIDSLIDGERRGAVLADLAKGRMRTAGKLADLSMALTGRFTGHHALMCRLHRDRIAGLDAAVADLDDQIAGRAGRWQRELDLLKTIPAFGDVVAQAWLAEIGPAPHRHFASHEKLASWVTLCPGNNISARKRKHGRTGDAGTYIKPVLIQAAWNAIRTKGRLKARDSRWRRRRSQEPRREEEGHHRDRAHPAQDRLPGPQERHPLPGPGRGLLHPPGITRPAARLPGTTAPEALSRLRHHHHHQPAGGRLNIHRQHHTLIPAAPEPPPNRHPRPAPAGQTSATTQPSPPPGPGFAPARPPGPSFRVSGGATDFDHYLC